MDEKEKMLTGEYYNPMSETLIEERKLAKSLCYKYNRDLDPKCLRELLGKTGDSFQIEPNFFCDYGYNIELGENFYSNHNLVILDPAKVSFGNNVFIGPNCAFYTAGHPLSVEERNKWLEYAKPITVGNNVWFGGGVTVLPGVTIGDNCTIGAGSVVTKDIPANSLAVGNPCKVIRQI